MSDKLIEFSDWQNSSVLVYERDVISELHSEGYLLVKPESKIKALIDAARAFERTPRSKSLNDLTDELHAAACAAAEEFRAEMVWPRLRQVEDDLWIVSDSSEKDVKTFNRLEDAEEFLGELTRSEGCY